VYNQVTSFDKQHKFVKVGISPDTTRKLFDKRPL